MSAGTLAQDVTPAAPSATAERTRAWLREPAIILAAALTLVAAALRFWRLGHQGFWFDEGNTALLVHFSPGKMLGLIPQTESTPPLYYCVAWVWARIFGYGEAGLRSLSALAGVATVPALYATGAKLVSRRVGLVAAALAAFNPYLIWYSQEARSYSLLVLLTAVSLLAWAYARAAPTARTLGAWVLACGLALATHYYALLVIVPQAIWLLVEHRRRRSVLVGVGLAGALGLALVPLAISQEGTGHASWIAPIPLDARLEQLFPQFLKGYQAPAQEILYPIGFAVVMLALTLLALRTTRLERRGALLLGGFALGGLALNLILIAAGIDDLITRNVIALWVPAALALACGLGARRAGPLGLAGAAVLCTIGAIGAIGVGLNRQYQRPDWRGVARVLGARPAAGVGTRALLVQHYRDLLPLSLYMPRLRFWPHHNPAITVRELDVVAFSAPRVHLCWWGAACNLSPTRLQSSYPVPGFRLVSQQRVYQFDVLRLVASRPIALRPQAVGRALTRTRLAADDLLFQR